MTETLTPPQRSERMSRVRGHDTKPEIRVRKLLHSMGFRFRLPRRDLPVRHIEWRYRRQSRWRCRRRPRSPIAIG
ncbi:hypothetical protein ACU8MG_25685 (plasmid) [Rhizobium leguminosarum]